MINVKKMRTDAEVFQGRYLAIYKEAVVELLDRLEAAERERDIANVRWRDLKRDSAARVSELIAERDALAAHVEHLHDALAEVAPWVPPADAPCHIGIVPQNKCGHCSRAMKARDALASKPETSLARQKAMWQAEALDEVVMVFADPCSESALDVVEYAAELAALKRRQAEEKK